MRFGFVLPFGDARAVAERAAAAEAAGWDAIFVWEAVWGVDAWLSLTAAALSTERLRLGTMLTPLPRIRPWDLASRVGTLDRLSGGRVQLAVGLGALHEGWTAFEADQGRATRAELLDEGLAVYAGLMRGQPFSFDGRHYQVRPTDFMVPDPPVQQPHPPVWVVGAARTSASGLVSTPSLERAARWEGLLPNVIGESGAGRRRLAGASGRAGRADPGASRGRRAAVGGLRRHRRGPLARRGPHRAGRPGQLGRGRRDLVGRGRLGPHRDRRTATASWTGGSPPGRRAEPSPSLWTCR